VSIGGTTASASLGLGAGVSDGGLSSGFAATSDISFGGQSLGIGANADLGLSTDLGLAADLGLSVGLGLSSGTSPGSTSGTGPGVSQGAVAAAISGMSPAERQRLRKTCAQVLANPAAATPVNVALCRLVVASR
jgi:hypothetical protein